MQKKKIFLKKPLMDLLQYCSCLFFFFGCIACGILVPQPGMEPAPHALEGKILTPGPPRKSPRGKAFRD